MPGRPAPIRQSDLARYLKAAADAKVNVRQVLITPDGTVALHLGDGDGAAQPLEADPWAARIAEVKD